MRPLAPASGPHPPSTDPAKARRCRPPDPCRCPPSVLHGALLPSLARTAAVGGAGAAVRPPRPAPSGGWATGRRQRDGHPGGLRMHGGEQRQRGLVALAAPVPAQLRPPLPRCSAQLRPPSFGRPCPSAPPNSGHPCPSTPSSSDRPCPPAPVPALAQVPSAPVPSVPSVSTRTEPNLPKPKLLGSYL